jgi:hypothetical protein
VTRTDHLKRGALLALFASACSGPESFPAGQWQIKSEIVRSDIGGREVGFAKGRTREWSSCIASSETKNPAGRFIPGVLSGSCKFSEASFANGRIAAKGECVSGALFPLRAELDGRFSNSSLSASLVTVEPNAGMVVGKVDEQDVTTRIAVEAKRTGDC